MRVGMLCSRMRVEEKLLRDALVHRGIEVEIVDDRELTLALGRPERRWDVVLERSLSQTRGLAAVRVLESWGVVTVNRHSVAAVCASKLDTSALLDAAGLPTPATVERTRLRLPTLAEKKVGTPGFAAGETKSKAAMTRS